MIDRRLQVLRAIGRHQTVTAAAEVCRLTPSAVSHQMKALAREIGVELFEHVGRTNQLTPAGHALLAHAEVLHAQWEHARADLAAHRASGLTGPLRFGGFSTAAAAFVPIALSRLQREHPHLTVQLRETEPAQAFDLLAAAEIDIAVVVATPDIPPASTPAFHQYPLYAEPLDILVGSDHRLADRATVALAEADTDRWIVGTPGRAYHQLVVLACATAGFAPHIAHYADEWDSGAALVARRLGVALVPRLADLPARHPTRRIPLTGEPSPTRHILAAVRAGSEHHPTIAAGLDALHQIIDHGFDVLHDPA